MATTNNKQTRKPATTKKPTTTTKSKNNESIGKTIFSNYLVYFQGKGFKVSTATNFTNLFYDKDDKKQSFKSIQKKFANSESYQVMTEILNDELNKALSKAMKKINKRLVDKDIKVKFNTNLYDSTEESKTSNNDIDF